MPLCYDSRPCSGPPGGHIHRHYWGAGREPPVPGSFDRPGPPRPLDPPDPPDADGAPGRLRPASSRSGSPTAADRPDETDRIATGDPPVRWSKADLRQRLERLPPGHPSSLRADTPDHDQPPGVWDPDGPTSAETTEQDGETRGEAKPDVQADAVKRNYWSEVPRFLRAWADHLRRWPAELVTVVDRSRDPVGSWRGDGNQYLDPERHAETNDEITRIHQAEKKLTGHMGEVERKNGCGAWLEGLEHRLKGDDRIKEKVADLWETGAPGATAKQIGREIPDAIRYTFCAEPENYKEVYWDIKDRLQVHGYEMYYSENHWSKTQYKGINTRWLTPEGQRFEVQFHTRESFHAKESVTHASYERLRNTLTRDDERQELMTFQEEVCSWIIAPEGVTDIPNYREGGH
jgi:hypothetical protein